jgi:hypothetical protein
LIIKLKGREKLYTLPDLIYIKDFMKSDYRYRHQDKSRKNVVYGIGIVAVAVMIFAVAFAELQVPAVQPTTTTLPPTTIPPTTTVPTTGTLLVSVKDVKQKLNIFGQATSLVLTVNSIQVHKTGTNITDENVTAEGWITIFSGSKTLDLLDYTDVKAILGEKELEPGKYTQIRLYIDNATIKIYDASMITNKTHKMVIAASGNVDVPSKVLKLNHPFTIEEGKTLSLTLDFDVPSSVIKPGINYVLKPVINILEEKLEKGEKPANSVVV